MQRPAECLQPCAPNGAAPSTAPPTALSVSTAHCTPPACVPHAAGMPGSSAAPGPAAREAWMTELPDEMVFNPSDKLMKQVGVQGGCAGLREWGLGPGPRCTRAG